MRWQMRQEVMREGACLPSGGIMGTLQLAEYCRHQPLEHLLLRLQVTEVFR